MKYSSVASHRVKTIVAATALLFIASLVASAQTETVLYNFTGGSDGKNPGSGLAIDSFGNLYGVAGGGDGCTSKSSPCGLVFSLSPTGTYTILHAFTGGRKDGKQPAAALIRGAKGVLYGTTKAGGPSSEGTVFKITPQGKETVLYFFTGLTDGGLPQATLFRDSAENLYGTTMQGGDASCGIAGTGCGTVFKVTPSGVETTLYSFHGGADGQFPAGGLVSDGAGNLYGTTQSGGINDGNCSLGCGTVFKIATDGTKTTLHSFNGESEGGQPSSSLFLDSKGNLYGETIGPSIAGMGSVVYQLAPNGSFRVVHRFLPPDGLIPYGGLIHDKQNYFYGTTNIGGANNCGSVFRLGGSVETLLYSFDCTSGDGREPMAGLVMDADGNLYGTTGSGGTSNFGTVFKITP